MVFILKQKRQMHFVFDNVLQRNIKIYVQRMDQGKKICLRLLNELSENYLVN